LFINAEKNNNLRPNDPCYTEDTHKAKEDRGKAEYLQRIT